VLFDWGETLMWIPGMIHDPDLHLGCVERIYESHMRPHLRSWGGELACKEFVDHYREACRVQIRKSRESQREHTFDDRLEAACMLAGVTAAPQRTILRLMADALGNEVVANARLLDHASEAVEALAPICRLGIVSNYPHGPVVEATLERFGLLQHFSIVVVSSETGWMKPHPECYLPALKALPAAPGRTLMVGDDLKNDVKGAKALGLRTAWLAPQARDIDPDVDIHLNHLGELPAHCERLFS
jgi:HAD superfamily hydrolase (TIGR01549 family)